LPTVSKLNKIDVGANVEAQHKNDQKAEERAIRAYNAGIRLADGAGYRIRASAAGPAPAIDGEPREIIGLRPRREGHRRNETRPEEKQKLHRFHFEL